MPELSPVEVEFLQLYSQHFPHCPECSHDIRVAWAGHATACVVWFIAMAPRLRVAYLKLLEELRRR